MRVQARSGVPPDGVRELMWTAFVGEDAMREMSTTASAQCTIVWGGDRAIAHGAG